MPFKRFVETGRVAYIADGRYKGRLCVIVDVINQTRALIDGPETGVPRIGIRLNQLYLTKFRLKFPFTASTRVVRKAWKDSEVDKKWAESAWAKKLEAKRKRAEMNDFDRYVLVNSRLTRNKIVTNYFLYLKRKLKKSRQSKKEAAKGKTPEKAKKEKKTVEKKTEVKKGAAKKAESKKLTTDSPSGWPTLSTENQSVVKQNNFNQLQELKSQASTSAVDSRLNILYGRIRSMHEEQKEIEEFMSSSQGLLNKQTNMLQVLEEKVSDLTKTNFNLKENKL